MYRFTKLGRERSEGNNLVHLEELATSAIIALLRTRHTATAQAPHSYCACATQLLRLRHTDSAQQPVEGHASHAVLHTHE